MSKPFVHQVLADEPSSSVKLDVFKEQYPELLKFFYEVAAVTESTRLINFRFEEITLGLLDHRPDCSYESGEFVDHHILVQHQHFFFLDGNDRIVTGDIKIIHRRKKYLLFGPIVEVKRLPGCGLVHPSKSVYEAIKFMGIGYADSITKIVSIGYNSMIIYYLPNGCNNLGEFIKKTKDEVKLF